MRARDQSEGNARLYFEGFPFPSATTAMILSRWEDWRGLYSRRILQMELFYRNQAKKRVFFGEICGKCSQTDLLLLLGAVSKS